MSEIVIGTIMIPDKNRNGFWIPISGEDSSTDYNMIGREAIVVERMIGNKVKLKLLTSGTQLFGMVDGDYYDHDVQHKEMEFPKKPFTTGKKCQSCDENYPDDFQYCEKCGRELNVVHKTNIFSSIPKSEVPLHLYDQFGVRRN